MIVRDDGDHWQVVLQPDHAALAGAIAAAWGGGAGLVAPDRLSSVVRACAHHDDGWLAWERMPTRDADGAPKTFFKVPTSRQMDFYRGVIATLDDVDPYAALLTSMHACGLYGADFGWTMTPVAPAYLADAARFVAEQARSHRARRQELGVDRDEVAYAFHLMQVADRVSLHLCMRPEDGGQTIQRLVRPDGTETPLDVAGTAPGTLELSPFPFDGDAVDLVLRRRTLPKRTWEDDDAFRASLWACAVEDRPIRLVAPGG
jgi:hypothetical protein